MICISASSLELRDPFELAVQGASLHVAMAVAQAKPSALKRPLHEKCWRDKFSNCSSVACSVTHGTPPMEGLVAVLQASSPALQPQKA